MLVKEATCLPSEECRGLALPSLPFPKAPFLPLLPALTAPVLTLISADGNPGQGCVYRPAVPLPSPGTADHAVLPYFKNQAPGRESPGGRFPVSWLLLRAAQRGYEKREDSHLLLRNTWKPPPLATCRSHPEAFQERAAFPAEAERPETLFQESHDCSVSACPKQHPALPSATNTVQGFNNSQRKRKKKKSQASTSASSYLRFWPRQITLAIAQPVFATSTSARRH